MSPEYESAQQVAAHVSAVANNHPKKQYFRLSRAEVDALWAYFSKTQNERSGAQS